jgi:hemolysin activation/secretion protein
MGVSSKGMAQVQVPPSLPTPAQVDQPQSLRQQERERARREKLERRPDVRLESNQGTLPTALPERESPCFPIATFELKGERAVEFQWALAATIQKTDPAKVPNANGESGRCLGAQGINVVMARVQNAIIERGFVTTRVVAQAQDLRSGVFVMTLVPGTVRAVRLTPDSDSRAHAASAIAIAPGRLLDLRDIEQGLENFKRLPSAEADIQIEPAQASAGQPAAAPGESDLLIRWVQGRPWRVGVSLDDAGTKATGKRQGSVNFGWDHPFGYNDQLALSLNHDLGGGGATPDDGPKGTRGGTLNYSLPWGAWQWSTSAGSSRYHQSVAGLDQRYIYSGSSATLDLKAARLLHRNAVRKVGAYGRVWLRDSKNFIDDTEVEVQRRKMRGWEAGLTHREFIGSGTLDGALGYRRGVGGMGALPAPEEAFDEGTSRMRLVTADVQWTQPFQLGRQMLRYSANLRGQRNQTRLVPQDRFSIAGRYTVRGFDGESTLTAERGWLVRNDLGWQWHPRAEIYVGLDHGRVGGPSAELLAGTKLTGAVLGVRGGLGGGTYGAWGYDLFVGRPLSQPEGFPEKSTNGGFQVSWTY